MKKVTQKWNVRKQENEIILKPYQEKSNKQNAEQEKTDESINQIWETIKDDVIQATENHKV